MSTPERLAYWYLRLNGFMTIENFVVHPDSGYDQRTDADLLAVRFADRSENVAKPMGDDPTVCRVETYANVIIAEVKSSACALNGPWTDPERANVERVLSSIGCFEPDGVGRAAESLYRSGFFSDDRATVRLFAFGDRHAAGEITATQVLFDEMIAFVWRRFKNYRRQKSSVAGWSRDGKAMREGYESCGGNEEYFRRHVRNIFGLPNGSQT